MTKETKEKIYKDEKSLRYLRENSHWYKKLNRDPNSINEFISEMKEKYGLRFKDKVEKAKTSLDLISAFMSVTKDE